MALGLMTVYEITPLSSNTHWWAPSKMMEPKAAVENSSTWWEAEPHWQTTVCGGDASFIFKLASMTTCCDSAATWLKHRTVRSKNPKAFTGAEELDIFRCCNWKCWKKKKGGEREKVRILWNAVKAAWLTGPTALRLIEMTFWKCPRTHSHTLTHSVSFDWGQRCSRTRLSFSAKRTLVKTIFLRWKWWLFPADFFFFFFLLGACQPPRAMLANWRLCCIKCNVTFGPFQRRWLFFSSATALTVNTFKTIRNKVQQHIDTHTRTHSVVPWTSVH